MHCKLDRPDHGAQKLVATVAATAARIYSQVSQGDSVCKQKQQCSLHAQTDLHSIKVDIILESIEGVYEMQMLQLRPVQLYVRQHWQSLLAAVTHLQGLWLGVSDGSLHDRHFCFFNQLGEVVRPQNGVQHREC